MTKNRLKKDTVTDEDIDLFREFKLVIEELFPPGTLFLCNFMLPGSGCQDGRLMTNMPKQQIKQMLSVMEEAISFVDGDSCVEIPPKPGLWMLQE